MNSKANSVKKKLVMKHDFEMEDAYKVKIQVLKLQVVQAFA